MKILSKYAVNSNIFDIFDITKEKTNTFGSIKAFLIVIKEKDKYHAMK